MNLYEYHFGCRVKNIHLLENGCAVIGNGDLAIASLNHFVHTTRSKTRADSIADS